MPKESREKSSPFACRVDHIIIQAGGKGNRLGELTKNKPKGIVPVDNKPIIFHLFDKFPDKKFIVIGDYLFDVLKKYLHAFANVKNIPVKATGTGTCGGIGQALEFVPDGEPFMIIWSDIILAEGFNLDFEVSGNLIGISKDFECRWRYKDGVFEESPSKEHGVAGLFIFTDKECLKDIPENGEFVRRLSQSGMEFDEISLSGAREVGTMEAYNEQENGIKNKEFRCRPFNELIFDGELVVKKYLDAQGKALAQREVDWYREAASLGFKQIPEITGYAPLTMKKIQGFNIFKKSRSEKEKLRLIDRLIASLSELHSLKTAQNDRFSILEAYYTKTMSRLSGVRELIPLADERHITVNGKSCRNVFFYRDSFYKKITDKLLDAEFAFIHGDCTFSNIMTDEELNITLLDPRGYFGFTELYGDVFYDWSKLYYSIFGNYDQFNNKRFKLTIEEKSVNLETASNGFEDAAEYFLQNIPNRDDEKVKLIHAIIWLSLTTYAREDYDSICGAFYNGLYYLEDLL